MHLPSIILALAITSTTAIDYLGGWNEDRKSCVNICTNSNPKPGCFPKDNPDPDCTAKLQRPGDYDILLYDQIFAPQYCRDLLYGNDSTITLQNVNPYPDGIVCDLARVGVGLFPHGLWPNYNNGYPGCCNVSDTISNQPFNPETFEAKFPDLFSRMDKEWVQPAISNATESLCHIYNHEYQKHGVCYRVFGDDWDKGASDYFNSTLHVNDRVKEATAQISEWASMGDEKMLMDIEGLYKKEVAILCSKYDLEKKNRFEAVRTCWAKPVDYETFGVVPGDQIDCAPTAPGSADACNASLPISFDLYVPPRPSKAGKIAKATNKPAAKAMKEPKA